MRTLPAASETKTQSGREEGVLLNRASKVLHECGPWWPRRETPPTWCLPTNPYCVAEHQVLALAPASPYTLYLSLPFAVVAGAVGRRYLSMDLRKGDGEERLSG